MQWGNPQTMKSGTPKSRGSMLPLRAKVTAVVMMKPQAMERIQSRLVLEAIVAAENIEATEDDFKEEMEKMASMYQMEADKLIESMGEYEKKGIMKDIAVTKAVKLVVDAAVEK